MTCPWGCQVVILTRRLLGVPLTLADSPPSTPTASMPASLAKIVQRFQKAELPKRKYELLLAYAKRLDPLPEDDHREEYKVTGCTSQVWITSQCADGQVQFFGDSDSQLVKGLVAVLVEGLSGLSPAEVVQVPAEFIQDTGLNVSLTPSRTNGFYNILKTMKQRALVYAAQGIPTPDQT